MTSPAQVRRIAGSLLATIEGRSDATAAVLLQVAQERGFWVSGDGRIGEADAAELLGLTSASLANKRREGSAPPSYSLGGKGHRVTYRIAEIALWIESHRDISG